MITTPGVAPQTDPLTDDPPRVQAGANRWKLDAADSRPIHTIVKRPRLQICDEGDRLIKPFRRFKGLARTSWPVSRIQPLSLIRGPYRGLGPSRGRQRPLPHHRTDRQSRVEFGPCWSA